MIGGSMVDNKRLRRSFYVWRRRPDLSREEAQRHWREVHGPMVQGYAKLTGLVRYVQMHTVDSPAATAPIAVIRRAAVLRSAGDLEAAVLLAEDATANVPDSYEAQHLYFALLSDLGRQTELEELLKRRLVDTPHDIELLLQLAEAMARQGKHYDSIRFYERAVLERSESVDLLNALAAEYLADEGGDVDRRERAIELLSRSLTLDPEQLGVRTTLERARKTQR